MLYYLVNLKTEEVEDLNELPENWKNIFNLSSLEDERLADLGWAHYPDYGFYKQDNLPSKYNNESKSTADARYIQNEKIKLKQEVDYEKTSLLSGGKQFTFSDGTTGYIQIADERDMLIINMLANAAIASKLNNSNNTFKFRDRENIIHTVDADEMLEIANAASDFVTKSYSALWQKKDKVEKAKTINELNNIS